MASHKIGGWVKVPRSVLEDYRNTNKLHAYLAVIESKDFYSGQITATARGLVRDFKISHRSARTIHARAVGDLDGHGQESEAAHDIHVNTGLDEGKRHTSVTGATHTIKETTGETTTLPQTDGAEGSSPKKPKADKSYTPEFERLWNAYPKTNGSKKAAFKRYCDPRLKLPRHELHIDEMLTAIESQIEHKAWCDRNREFCAEFPFLEKWLNEERWDNVKEVPNYEKPPPSGGRPQRRTPEDL